MKSFKFMKIPWTTKIIKNGCCNGQQNNLSQNHIFDYKNTKK